MGARDPCRPAWRQGSRAFQCLTLLPDPVLAQSRRPGEGLLNGSHQACVISMWCDERVKFEVWNSSMVVSGSSPRRGCVPALAVSDAGRIGSHSKE